MLPAPLPQSLPCCRLQTGQSFLLRTASHSCPFQRPHACPPARHTPRRGDTGLRSVLWNHRQTSSYRKAPICFWAPWCAYSGWTIKTTDQKCPDGSHRRFRPAPPGQSQRLPEHSADRHRVKSGRRHAAKTKNKSPQPDAVRQPPDLLQRSLHALPQCQRQKTVRGMPYGNALIRFRPASPP